MKKIIVLFALGFSACTNHKAVSEDPAAQLPLFNDLKAFSLPFSIDTTFILKADTSHRLSYTEVRALGLDLLKDEYTHELYDSFNEFCKIDSLKKNNAYAVYVDSLDIGMTKDAVACRLGYIVFKNNALMLVWGITNASYEACPVFSGTRIIGSYRRPGGSYTHVLLGNRSYWADPPSSYEIRLTTEIGTNEKFITEALAVSDDLDTPGEETTTATLKFRIEDDALKITSASKKVKNTEEIKE